jgi:hypothetical protein
VQIANPTVNPIKLKKGERVADMSIGQEWEIQDCNLDPTKEDHQKELFSENQQKAERTIRALVSFGVLQKGMRNKVPISPFEIKNDVASLPTGKGGGQAEGAACKNTGSFPTGKGGRQAEGAACDGSCSPSATTGCARVERGNDETVLLHHFVSEHSERVSPVTGRVGGVRKGTISAREAVEGCSSSAVTTPNVREEEGDTLPEMSISEKRKFIEDLGVDLAKTAECRTKEELDLVVAWCYSRRATITKDGRLDFTRRASHGTSMSIQTKVPDPVFKHYAGRTTPEQRKEIQKDGELSMEDGGWKR